MEKHFAKSDIGEIRKVLFPHDIAETWTLLQPILSNLASKDTNVDTIWKSLLQIYCITRNEQPENVDGITETSFSGLYFYYKELNGNEKETFCEKIMPTIACLAKDLVNMVPENGLSYIIRQIPGKVELDRIFVAGLVATGFLQLFPDPRYSPINQNSGDAEIKASHVEVSGLNFDDFFTFCYMGYQKAKLQCILHYFEKLATMDLNVKGKIIFERNVLKLGGEIKLDSLAESDVPLCPLVVFPEGKIEDAGSHVLQIDFANKYLGGGVLGEGNVQEEIRFSVCPELLAGMLFMEVMDPNEAIIIRGFEQFSQYAGYGEHLIFAGDFNDQSMCDSQGNIATEICAIDAVPYIGELTSQDQYTASHMSRDLNKAYAGFCQKDKQIWTEEELAAERGKPNWFFYLNPDKKKVVATGNWGCGIFGGDPQLKSLLQWVAASMAYCPAIVYYSFGNSQLKGLASASSDVLKKGWTVGHLICALTEICKTPNPEIFEQIAVQCKL